MNASLAAWPTRPSARTKAVMAQSLATEASSMRLKDTTYALLVMGLTSLPWRSRYYPKPGDARLAEIVVQQIPPPRLDKSIL